MSTLTIRIPAPEKKRLTAQAAKAGVSTAALVREMIQNRMLVTGDDILRELQQQRGNEKLRLRKA